MMNMQARNQYLQTLVREHGYLLRAKKEKSQLLDEYCKNTGQNRKYVIRKIRQGKYQHLYRTRKKRRLFYDKYVVAALARLWHIFDHPCGQRLKPLLQSEVARLRKLGELKCSQEVARKLKAISPKTIDLKLEHERQVTRLRRARHPKVHPLLCVKVPVKVASEQDRSQLGNIQADLVEHCGSSARGEYLSTLSTTDIATGWWEGEALANRGEYATQQGVTQTRSRYPFDWHEIHSDNGTEFINYHLYRYTQKTGLKFSRSRPYKKNDNCLVEQKNWTHVKRMVGYLRYDTAQEQQVLNELYRNELRLFKNFFQPVMKLKEKVRVGGKIHRKYDSPQTPYARVMALQDVTVETKRVLTEIYQSLNPAELKRSIDTKLCRLYAVYQEKKRLSASTVRPTKKLKPVSVTFLTAQPETVSVT